MGSDVHVLKCVSTKIAEKIRDSVQESGASFNDFPQFFIPQLNLSFKHGLNLKCRLRLRLTSKKNPFKQ